MQNLDTIVQAIKALPTYADIDESVISEVVEDCAYLYIRLRRCSEDVIFTSSELNWIKRASKEYLSKTLTDIPLGVKVYSESVYKLEFDSTTISQHLLDEVIPLAKAYPWYPKEEETTNNEENNSNSEEENSENHENTDSEENQENGEDNSTSNEG